MESKCPHKGRVCLELRAGQACHKISMKEKWSRGGCLIGERIDFQCGEDCKTKSCLRKEWALHHSLLSRAREEASDPLFLLKSYHMNVLFSVRFLIIRLTTFVSCNPKAQTSNNI